MTEVAGRNRDLERSGGKICEVERAAAVCLNARAVNVRDLGDIAGVGFDWPDLAGPIAKVPTGTPFGICMIDNRESSPLRTFVRTGTPSTGSSVFVATIPGRCAAPPAPAMITCSPRDSAAEAYSKSQSGVRCAETTCVSKGMSSSPSMSHAGAM